MAKILLMEPDSSRAERLQTVLTASGHQCSCFNDISSGLRHLEQGNRTMTILNARMPWAASAAFLDALKSRGLSVLLLATTAENVHHLENMYQSDCAVITEDCSDEELLTALDRLITSAPATLTLGDVSLDTETHVVSIAGRKEQLTNQEYELLHVLMIDHDIPVSREDLLYRAWGYATAGITRTVDVHVQRLRRKLGGSYIETIYRKGYRFAA